MYILKLDIVPQAYTEDIINALTGHEETVEGLDLSGQNLGRNHQCNLASLASNLVKIPSLSHIDLRNNHLHAKPTIELYGFVKRLGPQTRQLNLAGNYFGTMQINNLRFIFSKPSHKLESLDISDNELHRLSQNDFISLLKILSQCSHKLIIKGNHFSKSWQVNTLVEALVHFDGECGLGDTNFEREVQLALKLKKTAAEVMVSKNTRLSS